MAKSSKQQPDPRADIPEEYRPAEWLANSPHRPPNAETAFSHRDVLYAAIGRVLTAWEILETQLSDEFGRVLGSNQRSVKAAYGSIVSNKARIDTIRATAEITLSGEELRKHKVCMADVGRMANARNLVAHGVVCSWNEGVLISDLPQFPEKPGFGYVLAAAPYNTHKFNKPSGPTYVYSFREVEGIWVEIQKLQARLGAIVSGQYYKGIRFEV
jgi:hypothetical protein